MGYSLKHSSCSLLAHSLELWNTPHWREVSFFITYRSFKFSEVQLTMSIAKITVL